MIGRIIFCPGPFMHQHLQHIHLWFQRKQQWRMSWRSCLTMAREMPKYPLIHVKYARTILKSTRRSCKHRVITIFQKGNDHLAWDETISGATPLHCLAMTLLSNCPNLQKVGHDIVIFNGNVLGHAWHTWCKKYTNGKRMSCSLLICHTQIFKSIVFRTMGLWIWITFFFDTHCITWWIQIQDERNIIDQSRVAFFFWRAFFRAF